MKRLLTSALVLSLGWIAQTGSAQQIPPLRTARPIPITDSTPNPIVQADARDVDANAIQRVAAQDAVKPADMRAPEPTTLPSAPVAPAPAVVAGDACGPLRSSSIFESDMCCPERARVWVNVEYLRWQQRSQNVPPLVTADTNGIGGQLGDPNTRILSNNVPFQMRDGGRITAGFWFGSSDRLGFEASYFTLGRKSATSTFESDANTQIFRPFFDVGLQLQNADLADRVTIQAYSQLWGAEANARMKWLCGPSYWVDLVAGYRHLNLTEGIHITEQSGGGLFAVQERFDTRNQFNGAQLGFDSEFRFGDRLSVGFGAKVAIGNVHQIINIDGNTSFNIPGIAPTTQPGGLLTSPTNIGRYTDNKFGVLPQFNMKVGYDVNCRVRVFGGYDFLYMTNVVRPGEQIDLNVNPTFRPTPFGPGVGVGPRQPAVPFRESDFWAQGFSLGVQVSY